MAMDCEEALPRGSFARVAGYEGRGVGGHGVNTRFEDWFSRAFPEQASSLLNSGHPALIIIEAAYRDGATEEQIRIMAAAIRLGMSSGQVVGEDSQYFITLDQLGNLMKDDPASALL
jgi:hypothetical protein